MKNTILWSCFYTLLLYSHNISRVHYNNIKAQNEFLDFSYKIKLEQALRPRNARALANQVASYITLIL